MSEFMILYLRKSLSTFSKKRVKLDLLIYEAKIPDIDTSKSDTCRRGDIETDLCRQYGCNQFLA